MILSGPICPSCEATYDDCVDCGDTGSVALWKPEELKKGEKGCWTWLGRPEKAREAMQRFDEGLKLEARAWPSGAAVGPSGKHREATP